MAIRTIPSASAIRLAFCVLFATPPAFADEETRGDKSVIDPSATRLDRAIVVGRFVPPEPVPPKEVPVMRVESSVAVQKHGKRLTILRGEPSTLPDIPVPVPPEPLTPEQIAARAAFAASLPKPIQLNFHGMVLEREVGGNVSIIHWTHPENPRIAYQATVGLDIGVFSLVGNLHHRDRPHRLHLFSSRVPAAAYQRWRGIDAAFQEVEDGSFLITRGDPDDPVGMAPIIALISLYAAEKDHLIAGFGKLQQNQREAAAWHKANPQPEPAEYTLWLRPHRGRRYLDQKGGTR
jgi:hypothetical protein